MKDAVKYSDNIYFADKAIKIGEKSFIEGAKNFGIGEELKFEYPMSKSHISKSGKIEKEVLLGDTGYGQGEVLMSPLEVVLSYSALANEGKIMQPRLVISENSEAKVLKQAISSKHLPVLLDVFSAAVNDEDSTGVLGKIEGVNIVGKTGTAEIKNSKEDNNGTENGWFVALDADNSRLAVVMMIEDVKNKGGSNHVVPMVKNSMEYYISK